MQVLAGRTRIPYNLIILDVFFLDAILDARGERMGATGEEIGYQDAIRQVRRSLERRLKALQEALDGADDKRAQELRVRISEVEHMVRVVESLRR